VTTEEGIPVELAFLPGNASDVRALQVWPLHLPEGSELFMDSVYTDYGAEDALRELVDVTFAVCSVSVTRHAGMNRGEPITNS